MSRVELFPSLSALIEELNTEQDQITDQRKAELKDLATSCSQVFSEYGLLNITVICTHNSRRSQLAELWIRTLAHHYGLANIYTYSGGTEGTAFNHRMVHAVASAGWEVSQLDESENPKYLIAHSDEDRNTFIMYSKVYDENYNPQKNFLAILVCNSADEACPIVHGAAHRVALPYLDPKAFDDTEKESEAYSDKVREIGREMIYMMKEIVKG